MMNVTTLGYLMFLFMGIIVYYAFPIKHRWKWLIVLSFIYVFSSSLFGIIFVILTSLITFYAAKKIDESEEKKKKRILILSMSGCLSILIVLKYVFGLPFFAQPMEILGHMLPVGTFVKKYVLPIGISYYTLQTVSYLLDVYWERYQAEQDYLKILLFTCYFPQMLQGPISKYNELAPELFKEHPFQWKNIKFGVQLMLWGFFKKLLIADRLSGVVAAIFSGEETAYGMTIVVGLVFYGIQLYCDFSGGIDIIRGVSEMLGIRLKDNFRQPYFSLSLEDFWQRWHISLGQWMKDYLFYPISVGEWMMRLNKLLKKRVSRKTAIRIGIAFSNVIVFLVVGAWHGLESNFLGWGLYNGLILAISALLIERYTVWKKKLHINEKSFGWHVFCILRTFIIVSVGRIFDCVSTAGDAVIQFTRIFAIQKTDFSMIVMGKTDIAVLLIGAISILAVDILHEKGISVRETISQKSYGTQVIVWTMVVQMIACFGKILSEGGFLYANF